MISLGFNNDVARQKITRQIKTKLKRIKTVKVGACRFNQKCHMNSAHEAIINNHKKLALVMCLNNGYPYIHFINHYKGKFTDNTLGAWSKTEDYYFVRWVYKEDFYDVNGIFIEYAAQLRQDLGWWLRLTSNETF